MYAALPCQGHLKSMEIRRIRLKRSESRYSVRMISPAQCRAARGLLDWTQQKLADEARVGVVTIRQLESGAVAPRRATLEVVQRALETAGVQFINKNGGGPGVRLSSS